MFFIGKADEVKFLLYVYAHRNVKSNVPFKAVETLVQSDDILEQDTVEQVLVKEETDAILAELENARIDSSCKSGEAEFVELQPEKRKKRSFSEWISRKKRGFCKAFSRICCCYKNNTTVSWFSFSF